jgi:hypothetical protein
MAKLTELCAREGDLANARACFEILGGMCAVRPTGPTFTYVKVGGVYGISAAPIS